MNLHVDLAHPRKLGPEPWSIRRILRAFAFFVSVTVVVVLYAAGVVWLATRLHLDFEVGSSLGFGGLLLLAGVVGFTRLVQETQPLRPFAVYLIVIGLFMSGFGAYRQERIVHARHECAEALAQATDAHARIQVFFRSARGVPSLDDRSSRPLTCRDLLQN